MEIRYTTMAKEVTKQRNDSPDLMFPPQGITTMSALKELSPLGEKLDRIAELAFTCRDDPSAKKFTNYLSLRRWMPRWKELYPDPNERIRHVEEYFGMERLQEDAHEINVWLRKAKWKGSGITARDLAKIVSCELMKRT